MTFVTLIWAVGAASTLTFTLLYGLVWLTDTRRLENLMFCFTVVGFVGLAGVELGMMHAASAAEYERWAYWYHLPLFVGMTAQVLFVRYYLRSGRDWLLWTVILTRLGVLVANFLLEPSFNFERINSIAHVSFLGEQVTVIGSAAVRSWQWLPLLNCVLFVAYIADAALTLWRRGGAEARQRALVVGVGFVVPLALAVALTQGAVLGIGRLPILGAPSFLLTAAVMAVELSRQLLLGRRAREEAAELRSELARVGRITALGRLATALAHELNQPLGAILRNAEAAELLLEQPVPDITELKAIMADIRKDDSRAGAVIDKMRAMIKRSSAETRSVPVQELVRDTLALARAEALERQVILNCSFATSLPPVAADRVQISQVLLNLIINGMDAMATCPPPGRRLMIEAHAADAATVQVTVADSGPGIRPEMVARMFDPFFTTKPDGMGMGLPVSRSIVEAHGGRLWAEANVGGHGLSLRFTLPRAATGLA
jgi:signal transduction histidine kinase